MKGKINVEVEGLAKMKRGRVKEGKRSRNRENNKGAECREVEHEQQKLAVAYLEMSLGAVEEEDS